MKTKNIRKDNQRKILMELAIEKALQFSPYAGAACLAINGESKVIGSTVGYIADNSKLVEELTAKINPADNSVLILTQEIMATRQQLEKLADKMEAKKVKEVHVCNDASGGQAGEFISILKARGVECTNGTLAPKLLEQKVILERFYNSKRPWLCCLLAIDDDGSTLGLDQFSSQFGFLTHFSNLKNRFPLCFLDSEAGVLPEPEKITAELINQNLNAEAIIEFSLAGNKQGTNEINELCKLKDAPAAILVSTTSTLNDPSLIEAMDEVVVYQMNSRQLDIETSSTDLSILLPDDNWQLADKSPLGDSIFFRYIRIKQQI